MGYHYDPEQALEELNEEVLLPTPVQVRDLVFRAALPARQARQALLSDADDTLWEETLHFEQAIDAYVALVSPLGYPPEHVRRTLDLAERRNILERGYGAWSFALTLEGVYLELAGGRADTAHAGGRRRSARV